MKTAREVACYFGDCPGDPGSNDQQRHNAWCNDITEAIGARDREHAAALAQARADALGEAERGCEFYARVTAPPGVASEEYMSGYVQGARHCVAQVRALRSPITNVSPPVKCDGSGYLWMGRAIKEAAGTRCPGCPNCKSKERR